MNKPPTLTVPCLLILLSACVACACAKLWAIDAGQIQIAVLSDRIHTWTSPRTVAVASNGTIWTPEGQFTDVLVTNSARVQVISIESTNGLRTSTDLAAWEEIKPPGYAYSPNVVLVGAPSGQRFFAELPPPGIFRIAVDRSLPGVEIVSCYVATNCPDRWRIECSEGDLQSWRTWSSWPVTNERRRYTVPRLRDDARLVDWFILKPGPARFFRLTILP